MASENDGLGKAFGVALRAIRLRRGLSIMDLSGHVSGRTYLGALERGEKQPTLAKIDVIARHLGIHPLALLALTYQTQERADLEVLLAQVQFDLDSVKISDPWNHWTGPSRDDPNT